MSESLSPLFLPRPQILPLKTETPPSQEDSSDYDSPPLVSASPSPLPSPPNVNNNVTLNIIEEVIDLADRTNKLKLNFLGDLDPMKSLSRLSVNSLRLFTIFEEEKVLDVIDDDQSSEHRQLGNINQSHFYSLFFDEFF